MTSISKGSTFLKERLKERESLFTEDEKKSIERSKQFISVYMDQIENWFLNHIEMQLFGCGDQLHVYLSSKDVYWAASLEFVYLDKNSYVVGRFRNAKRTDVKFSCVEDLGLAKEFGQEAMVGIGNSKSYRKKHCKSAS